MDRFGLDVSGPVMAASLDAIIITDARGRVLEFNPAAEAMFGHARAETLGKPIGELIVPDHHRAAHEAGMARYTAGNPARVLGRRMEMEALRADGTIFPVELAITEAESDGQRFFAASLRDLTEARQRARELEQTSRENALYRRLFEAMPDSIYAKDLEGRFIAANSALADAMGAESPRDLIGTTDADWHPPDVAASYAAAERDLFESGEESRILTQPLWHADGSQSWQITRKAIFRDENGTVIGLIGHGRDVTEQVRAEQALAASEARFAAFAENAPVAMFLKDEQGRYVMLNGEAVKVIGSPRDQIIGRTAREVGTTPSADVTDAADARLRSTGKPLRTIGKLAAEGEAYHWAMVLRFPMAAPTGEGMWIGGFAIDMTAQRATELDLERSREALHQSEKLNAMGSLLAGVAHELNNPLAIVVAQATMMEEDAAGTPLATRAEKIRRAAERCGRIVQTFLGLARRKPAERQRVGLNGMVTAAVDLMAYPLRTAGIDVGLDLSGTEPATDGDPDMLNQVVLNLLVNAHQALEGCDGVRAIRITTANQGEDVVIEVGDSGPGVPEAIRNRIFEPFFSTKPQGVGTGVGLSFCHSVVSAHQGKLELLPAGRGLARMPGATFRVTLPAAAISATASIAGAMSPGLAVAGKALVIDDEPELAEVLADILQAAGYATDVATSAIEAQRLVGLGDYDIILSDLRMPGMDGPAFFAWLETEWPALARRVAFVTGDALGAAAADFLARAGRPVLEKPFSRAGVLRVVAKARGDAA